MTRWQLGAAAMLTCAAPAMADSPPVPAEWPTGAAYAGPNVDAPAYSYRDVMGDPRLVRVIDLALAYNQDVAQALANIEAARAQYRIQRAAGLPQIDAGVGYNRAGGSGTLLGGNTAVKGDLFSASGTVASYEIDLFGRVKSLTAAQKARFLASEAAARAARLTLVADVADAWLRLAADASLLRIARDTAAAAQSSVRLTSRRVAGGIAPLTDQRQAELTLHIAEADIAADTSALAQDANALRLLAGAEVPSEDLPTNIADASAHIAVVPAGMSSAVLLRRPDVAESELALTAAKANVGAARAALFPRITLTGLAGVASAALGSLFTGGAFAWGVGPAISWPIFNGGASKANLALSKAQADAALAEYRKAIQSAFADVSNALARSGTIDAQLAAVQGEESAAADNARLVDRRYRGGISSYLDSLTATQALYASQKSLVATQLASASSRIALYRALGGDAPGETVGH